MSGFVIKSYDDPQFFWNEVAVPLMAREIENNVFLIVADRMRQDPQPNHWRYGVFREGALVLAAWMTPPFRLGLVDLGDGQIAMQALVEHLANDGRSVPGINGPTRLTVPFSQSWCARTGAVIADGIMHGHRQNFYRVETAVLPKVPGKMRRGVDAEAKMLIDWQVQFAIDAGLPETERDRTFVAERVGGWIRDGIVFVWETDAGPVSCAVERPFLDRGARITGVYTPHQHRGCGYASAVTAALSAQILARGRWCTLFADASNPLTNRIYQRIGYRAIGLYDDIHFSYV